MKTGRAYTAARSAARWRVGICEWRRAKVVGHVVTQFAPTPSNLGVVASTFTLGFDHAPTIRKGG